MKEIDESFPYSPSGGETKSFVKAGAHSSISQENPEVVTNSAVVETVTNDNGDAGESGNITTKRGTKSMRPGSDTVKATKRMSIMGRRRRINRIATVDFLHQGERLWSD